MSNDLYMASVERNCDSGCIVGLKRSKGFIKFTRIVMLFLRWFEMCVLQVWLEHCAERGIGCARQDA